MPVEQKRKPREKPGPYGPRKKASKSKNPPATSAVAQTTQRENLTLHDWMTVLKFIDLHPDLGQADVVKHFRTKKDDALIFTQSTLSRKLKMRSELEARVQTNPNALSCKRPRVVTRPDVERALVLWFQHMESKGETVNGPMLQTKRQMFEEKFGIPESERLIGDGWIASFCKTYRSTWLESCLFADGDPDIRLRNVEDMERQHLLTLLQLRQSGSVFGKSWQHLHPEIAGISMKRACLHLHRLTED